MVIKCKMCGGDLYPSDNSTTCECEFCGTVQTIPSDDGEKKANLFNRANRLRMNAEFDKAAAVYENIAAEFPEEAEAYWGLCLCAYGIEYVDDPGTGEKKPTCHRTLPTSIMEDSNFEQACDNADAIARRVYREEAKAIDQIQKDILAIVSSEEPYDVFICYKETAEEGGRTEDSVLAEEIYDALTGKGLKVFFARISLEDKLGQQYEPYIYAALSSARVMLAIGTKFDYYDAVWVKNEWMRFLFMMKSDRQKTLIPCYKSLDAYDMPKEFRNLQAQDMGKLGWLQDLTRGILKLCGKDKQQAQVQPSAEFIESLVQQITGDNKIPAKKSIGDICKRAFELLENEKWEKADECAEEILEEEPSNAQAYLIKLLAETESKGINELRWNSYNIEKKDNYKKILRFGTDEQRKQVCQIVARRYMPEVKTVENYQTVKNSLLEKFDANDIAPILDEIEQQISKIIEDEKDAALDELSRVKTITECQMIRAKIQSIKGLEHQQDALALVDKKVAEIRTTENRRWYINSRISKLEAEFSTKEQLAFSTEREMKKAQNDLDSARKECDKLTETIHKYDIELKNLHGLFTRKRRRELEELIAGETSRLKQVKERVLSLESVWNIARSKVTSKPDDQELSYMIAKEYYDARMYTEAFTEYQKIPNYKDVASILCNDTQMRVAVFEQFTKEGSIVSFGRYNVNNAQSKDPIEWLTLDVQGTRSLLVTKYSIEMKPYHHVDEGNWIKCDIRAWLNTEFFNSAFTSAEQSFIQLSSLEYITGRKATCHDKVFLLSEPEVNKYFPTLALRKCPVSPYIFSQYSESEKKFYRKYGNSECWWERSNSDIKESPDGYADYILFDGSCSSDIVSCKLGIRPAVWVNIG